MKKGFNALILLLVTVSLFSAACKKSDDDKTDDNSTSREASFKIGATTFSVTKPYIGVFNDNGTIKNTMTLTATDGSKVEFYFVGSSSATYPLQSFSNGYYKNAAGKQYNSTSGELIISSYSIDGSTYKASGTFHFKAKTFASPIDSLEITEGTFTNASNEQ